MTEILIKGILGGIAATGFAILFNVPSRLLFNIFGLGVIALLVKNICLEYFQINIILTSFLSSSTIGIMGLIFSKIKRTPPLILAIPSVIPLVPGIFIYNTIIGLMKIPVASNTEFYDIFIQITNNGLKAIFILMGLAIGVTIPSLVLRQESFFEGAGKK
jgi:uncharacterized membrane protein YjjB (DUF3815 family)